MKLKDSSLDLTDGNPTKQILLFSIPLVLGTLFQQLYSFADAVIVGRCIGTDALAAVGATYSLNFLILGFIQGFCVGLGIPIAQAFGEKDSDKLLGTFWNGLYITVILFCILTVVMYYSTTSLLQIINTPNELFLSSCDYIRIIFLGLPITMTYNYFTSVLRALGDSKHPFYFLLISCIINIVLDYICIVNLQMGVRGAAWATVISQLFSCLLTTLWLFLRANIIELHQEHLQVSKVYITRLLSIAFPMGFEYSISAIGAMVLQNSINTFGSTTIAAQTTGEKIRQMFTLPMESVGMAMATYVGQNYGAKQYERIKKGIKSGLSIQYTYCIVVWIVLYFVKVPFVQFVLGTTTTPEALGAIKYLAIISSLFVLHGSLMIFRNTLQGLGYGFEAILSGVGELIGRSIGGYIAIATMSFTVICLANPLSWALGLVYCIVMVNIHLKRLKEN